MSAKTLSGQCDSCLMPFKKDPLGANREHEQYCSYCYKDGALCYQGNDVKEFSQVAYDSMVSHGTSPWKAKFFSWLIQFAPRWKK